MNISITIPKGRSSSWYGEVKEAKEQDLELWFKAPVGPKHVMAGEKYYVIIDGFVVGYHIIKYFRFSVEGFKCEITGEEWGPGHYIIRDGKSWVNFYIPQPELKSHRGFRYIREDIEGDVT